MSALRHTHRQMDWRKLNVAHGNRQRRCHDRQTYGILQPMDCDREPIPMWAWMLAAVFLSPFVAALIGGMAQ